MNPSVCTYDTYNDAGVALLSWLQERFPHRLRISRVTDLSVAGHSSYCWCEINLGQEAWKHPKRNRGDRVTIILNPSASWAYFDQHFYFADARDATLFKMFFGT